MCLSLPLRNKHRLPFELKMRYPSTSSSTDMPVKQLKKKQGFFQKVKSKRRRSGYAASRGPGALCPLSKNEHHPKISTRTKSEMKDRGSLTDDKLMIAQRTICKRPSHYRGLAGIVTHTHAGLCTCMAVIAHGVQHPAGER